LIKKALFMEGSVPKGGTCLSSFLVLKGKSGILVGKMAKPEIWIDRFLVGEMFAPKYVSSNKWLIPASHLKYGEKPEDAAIRVLVEQVGSKRIKLRFLQVQSHLSQDPNDPEAAHWDICFVYGGTLKGKIQTPEWFSELRFVKPQDIGSGDFTRGHGDVLKELGIVKR
jgi:ADP-ribose pyrophosphatase YjhB (NUDIX family)